MGAYMEIFEARFWGEILVFGFTWKYLKQGFCGKTLVFDEKSPILRIVSCLHENFSKHGWI